MKSTYNIFLFRIAVLAFVALFNFGALWKSGVSVWFYLNRDVIATELCAQKEVAGNCCKGVCVLKTELEKSGDEKSPVLPSVPNRNIIELVLFFDACPIFGNEVSLSSDCVDRYAFSEITFVTSPLALPPCL